MATEKRLIDANALMKAHVWKCGGDPYDQYYMGYQDALDNVEVIIENQPTVDAVEVVRCKDCTFWTYEGIGSSTMKRFGSCAKWYPFGNEQHSCYYDDFCSYGERKDNGK